MDNLLFNYASHHNVLEKVVKYESELASQDMRDSLKAKEDTIQSLTGELEDLRRKGGSLHHPLTISSPRVKRESDLMRDDIQGRFLVFRILRHLNFS